MGIGLGTDFDQSRLEFITKGFLKSPVVFVDVFVGLDWAIIDFVSQVPNRSNSKVEHAMVYKRRLIIICSR